MILEYRNKKLSKYYSFCKCMKNNKQNYFFPRKCTKHIEINKVHQNTSKISHTPPMTLEYRHKKIKLYSFS